MSKANLILKGKVKVIRFRNHSRPLCDQYQIWYILTQYFCNSLTLAGIMLFRYIHINNTEFGNPLQSFALYYPTGLLQLWQLLLNRYSHCSNTQALLYLIYNLDLWPWGYGHILFPIIWIYQCLQLHPKYMCLDRCFNQRNCSVSFIM